MKCHVCACEDARHTCCPSGFEIRMPGPEIEKVLTLSTSHMPKAEPDFGEAIRVTEHDYGYIVFLTSPESLTDIDGSMPNVAEWLKPIIRLAWTFKCAYINFDADAGAATGLQQWEW